MSLYQDNFQDIQEFWDQYMALCKVSTELGLRFGQCEDEAKAELYYYQKVWLNLVNNN